jgi:hypothetical protein
LEPGNTKLSSYPKRQDTIDYSVKAIPENRIAYKISTRINSWSIHDPQDVIEATPWRGEVIAQGLHYKWNSFSHGDGFTCFRSLADARMQIKLMLSRPINYSLNFKAYIIRLIYYMGGLGERPEPDAAIIPNARVAIVTEYTVGPIVEVASL